MSKLRSAAIVVIVVATTISLRRPGTVICRNSRIGPAPSTRTCVVQACGDLLNPCEEEYEAEAVHDPCAHEAYSRHSPREIAEPRAAHRAEAYGIKRAVQRAIGTVNPLPRDPDYNKGKHLRQEEDCAEYR